MIIIITDFSSKVGFLLQSCLSCHKHSSCISIHSFLSLSSISSVTWSSQWSCIQHNILCSQCNPVVLQASLVHINSPIFVTIRWSVNSKNQLPEKKNVFNHRKWEYIILALRFCFDENRVIVLCYVVASSGLAVGVVKCQVKCFECLKRNWKKGDHASCARFWFFWAISCGNSQHVHTTVTLN
jgi:hypothetical protein